MRWRCASTMSPMVMRGKSSPYGRPPFPARGEDGPVEPLHPPMKLEQMTKNLRVSKPLPGPIMSSHQPGRLSSREW